MILVTAISAVYKNTHLVATIFHFMCRISDVQVTKKVFPKWQITVFVSSVQCSVKS